MSDWDYLNKCRIQPGKSEQFGSRPSDGFNGAFHCTFRGIEVLIISSDGGGWEHVSVSLVKHPKRTPSWQTMCDVKCTFWNPDMAVMQLHPPEAMYVNHHPGCLHLWRPIGDTPPIPLPPPSFLGLETKDGKSTFELPEP